MTIISKKLKLRKDIVKILETTKVTASTIKFCNMNI